MGGAEAGWLSRLGMGGAGPAKVSNVTVTAATIHAATAVVAIAAPGLARMLAQLARRAACENSAAQVESARRTTRRR